MEKNIQPANPARENEQANVLYIDGCKISVRYSGEKNPALIRNIKNVLISGSPAKKS